MKYTKTYENFIKNLFKSKLTPRKFADLLKDFCQLVINDRISFTSSHNFNKKSSAYGSLNYSIGSFSLEHYIFIISFFEDSQKDISFEIEKLDLHPAEIKNYKEIIDQIQSVQEYLDYLLSPFNYNENFIKMTDLSTIVDKLNKNDYELFISTNKYNL